MPTPFTTEQWKQVTDYEKQIAHIEELRRGPHQKWYESTLWVGSLTAIVTLVLTAALGYLSQESLTTRQEKQARRTQHAAAIRDAMINAVALLSTMFKANEERLLLMEGKMDVLPDAERDSIRRNTNAIQQRWRGERDKAALLLYLYAGPKADTEWTTMSVQLEKYTACIEDAYASYDQRIAPDTTCMRMKSRAQDAVSILRTALRNRLLELEGPE